MNQFKRQNNKPMGIRTIGKSQRGHISQYLVLSILLRYKCGWHP
jgi:hypothetical protein